MRGRANSLDSLLSMEKRGGKQKRRILGIDPGFGRLGYAILETQEGALNLIKSDCVETSSKKSRHERLLDIANNIDNIIKKYNPEVVAIERVFFAKNQKTALDVSEVKGVMSYLALSKKLLYLKLHFLRVIAIQAFFFLDWLIE